VARNYRQVNLSRVASGLPASRKSQFIASFHPATCQACACFSFGAQAMKSRANSQDCFGYWPSAIGYRPFGEAALLQRSCQFGS
jgi:hypothetical protein